MHVNFTPMTSQNIRMLCTGLLCVSCIFVCVIQKLRISSAKQQIQKLQTLNWQNQQLNQYIAHRILLAPHREALGFSQWAPSETKGESFCETMYKVLQWPTGWATLTDLDSSWQHRLAITPWLNTLDKEPRLNQSLKGAYVKLKALPHWSKSLCSLEVSTKISDSKPLASIIKFTNQRKTGT